MAGSQQTCGVLHDDPIVGLLIGLLGFVRRDGSIRTILAVLCSNGGFGGCGGGRLTAFLGPPTRSGHWIDDRPWWMSRIHRDGVARFMFGGRTLVDSGGWLAGEGWRVEAGVWMVKTLDVGC